MMCCSLDVIGDTEMAFRAHKDVPNEPNFGLSYLLVYGFIQALILQQDAVSNLCCALDFPFELDSSLKTIRQIRNDAVGHPTNRGNGKSFNSINRNTLSNGGFQLITHGRDYGYEYKKVSLGDLLNTQQEQLEKVLEALIHSLWKEEMEHRQQFRKEKLEDLFSYDIDSFTHKVFESIPGTSASLWKFGGKFIQQFIDTVDKFKSALERRADPGTFEVAEYQIEELECLLISLKEYFEAQGKGQSNDKDAKIFAECVGGKLLELKNLAREIDVEYSSDPDNPAVRV